jgi:phosphoribosylformylglycinamidine synthase
MAECCFDTGGVGAEVSIAGVSVARDARMNEAAALFGESATRIVISLGSEDLTAVLERAAAAKVPARVIGRTGGNLLRIAVAGDMAIDVPVDEAERVWSTAIEQPLRKQAA